MSSLHGCSPTAQSAPPPRRLLGTELRFIAWSLVYDWQTELDQAGPATLAVPDRPRQTAGSTACEAFHTPALRVFAHLVWLLSQTASAHALSLTEHTHPS